MSMNFTWRAQSTIYRQSIDLLALREIGGELEIIEPLVISVRRMNLYEAISQPSLALEPDSARSLMQALWDAGIRPAEFKSTDAEVIALKSHIDFAEHVGKTLLAKSCE